MALTVELADYRTQQEPDFRLEFVGNPPAECERLRRDTSVRAGRYLILRYAGWFAAIDSGRDGFRPHPK